MGFLIVSFFMFPLKCLYRIHVFWAYQKHWQQFARYISSTLALHKPLRDTEPLPDRVAVKELKLSYHNSKHHVIYHILYSYDGHSN